MGVKPQYDFQGAKRGAIVTSPTKKTRITIRLDGDILEWFRERADSSGGGNYQTMINEALRHHITTEHESVEDLVRRVIRDELVRYKS